MGRKKPRNSGGFHLIMHPHLRALWGEAPIDHIQCRCWKHIHESGNHLMQVHLPYRQLFWLCGLLH